MTSDVTYHNQDNDLVGRATCIMIMAAQIGTQLMMEHEIRAYSEEEIANMEKAWRAEERRGGTPRYVEDVHVGDEIPSILRGPLTIGDMVAWNAAIGPSYKAGSWGYLDLKGAMHTAMFNPETNFRSSIPSSMRTSSWLPAVACLRLLTMA